ncbi:YezD family protein [Nitrosomonas communis]|uniref:YezD family protein n=1 Tax=Nitrosomonas communis TaxID=44574 RepID=UPI0026EDCB4C|nr:YezD family protein [Nitrosomonas communis]MCO6427817.1 YezD family protein [Nitrosomonas communis]
MTNSTTPANSRSVPQDIQQEILRAIASIQYGSVEIVIHANQVVQIECREKIRIHQVDPIHKLK